MLKSGGASWVAAVRRTHHRERRAALAAVTSLRSCSLVRGATCDGFERQISTTTHSYAKQAIMEYRCWRLDRWRPVKSLNSSDGSKRGGPYGLGRYS